MQDIRPGKIKNDFVVRVHIRKDYCLKCLADFTEDTAIALDDVMFVPLYWYEAKCPHRDAFWGEPHFGEHLFISVFEGENYVKERHAERVSGFEVCEKSKNYAIQRGLVFVRERLRGISKTILPRLRKKVD